jgi:hypothetical protein
MLLGTVLPLGLVEASAVGFVRVVGLAIAGEFTPRVRRAAFYYTPSSSSGEPFLRVKL